MKRDTPVKVLVVGDSGVGKSQLVNILTSRSKLSQAGWTIGVNIEVAVHDYHPATDEATYLIELWDISGNQAHKNSRSVFYRGLYRNKFLRLIFRFSRSNLRPRFDQPQKSVKFNVK